MQDILDYAGTLGKWTREAGRQQSLEELSVLAHAALDCPDTQERAAAKSILLQRGRALGCRRDLERMMRAMEEERARERLRQAAPDTSEWPYLKRDGQGRIANTIENYSWILSADPFFSHLKYDELQDAPAAVWYDFSGISVLRRWVDADDAAAMEYIEATYGLYDRAKYRAAFLQRMRDVRFHPVRETIEGIEWDGQARIERFLHDWMGCADDDYTREVSRLIFAGGIRRLYEPGCKFDYLPVLVGTQQGEGKSTLVRWLALDDRWYGEVTLFEGKEAIEQLQGVWICEVSELLAFRRAREQELVKSFLSRQCDRYRRPYAERTEDLPRRSIMIGTTNNRTFLRDKTGNRRFLPVEVHTDAQALYAREDEVRACIRQCWAEALARYREGKLPSVADVQLREAFRQAQDAAMEDDWRVGAIEAYLAQKPAGSYVCVRSLMREALCRDTAMLEPSRRDSLELGQIMDRMPGWERAGVVRFAQYGRQKSWKNLGQPAAAEKTEPG